MRDLELSALARGGWKKVIYGRCFTWPGSLDQGEAARQALLLTLAAKRLKLLGLPWTDGEVDVALNVGGGLPVNRQKAKDRREHERVEREKRERAERRRRERDTLHAGLDDYAAYLGGREVSAAYKARGRAAIGLMKRLAVDVPLHRFDLECLGVAVDTLHAGGWASATIKTTLHFFREALDYLDTRGRWELTRRGEKLLKPRRLKTAVAVEVFTVDELQGLYGRASDLVRACILLGLNCGFTVAELSSLTGEHLDQDGGGAWWVVKARTKTGVAGEWKLWPETVAALERLGGLEAVGTERHVLRNGRGGPLMHYCEASGERADALGRSWHRLTRGLPEGRRLGFKYLRKTGATWIASVSSDSIAERYLAHTGGTVAKRHYLAIGSSEVLCEALNGVRMKYVKGMGCEAVGVDVKALAG